MKKIKNIIITAATSVAVGFGFTSCDIDLLPLNEVVYENFWTNKDDVESVVASAYLGMTSSDYVSRLITWGENRSDNTQPGNNLGDDLRFLMKGSIKTTNGYNDWSSFYKTINYCNVVLAEAPRVNEKDPNYTDSDYKINIAECKFIRAYSYLTLIKTFKNVPFTFEASLDDNQTYRIPQTKFEVILDSLIQDIESCKNFAPNRYSEIEKNTGRVTRAAMYSLLAELYLWRASDFNLSKAQQNEYYRKCIENCDWVLNYKINQYETNDIDNLDLRTVVDKEVYKEYGYPLLAEEMTPGTNKGGPEATNLIFGEGGSFETIFEITYEYRGQSMNNGAVNSMFGTSSSSQSVIAADKVLEGKPENSASYSDERLFSVPSDYRSIASFYFNESSGGYNIYKYVVGDNRAGDPNGDFGRVGTAFVPATKTQSYSRSSEAPWILYRLTEVMLFRAEAEIELAFNMDAIAAEPEEEPEQGEGEIVEGEGAEGEDSEIVEGEGTEGAEGSEAKPRKVSVALMGADLATAEELKDDAFDLISAVYRRSNPIVKTQPKYAPVQPTNYDGYHKLLMNERRREFLFEGKRYFDLVRSARRIGNTSEYRRALATKFAETNGGAVANKMTQMDFMYMPVLRAEMKLNPELVQNSCYLDELENLKN